MPPRVLFRDSFPSSNKKTEESNISCTNSSLKQTASVSTTTNPISTNTTSSSRLPPQQLVSNSMSTSTSTIRQQQRLPTEETTNNKATTTTQQPRLPTTVTRNTMLSTSSQKPRLPTQSTAIQQPRLPTTETRNTMSSTTTHQLSLPTAVTRNINSSTASQQPRLLTTVTTNNISSTATQQHRLPTAVTTNNILSTATQQGSNLTTTTTSEQLTTAVQMIDLRLQQTRQAYNKLAQAYHALQSELKVLKQDNTTMKNAMKQLMSLLVKSGIGTSQLPTTQAESVDDHPSTEPSTTVPPIRPQQQSTVPSIGPQQSSTVPPIRPQQPSNESSSVQQASISSLPHSLLTTQETTSPVNSSHLPTENTTRAPSDSIHANHPLYKDIAPQYVIDYKSLELLFTHSLNASYFARELVKRLFPKLFGPGQLRFQYNYRGNVKGKEPLDFTGKLALERYICHFYPSCENRFIFQSMVIGPINTMLRQRYP